MNNTSETSPGSATPGSAAPSAPGPARPPVAATSGPATSGAAGPLDAAALGRPLGEVATWLQLSSAFCAPCRATRHVLERAAATAPGVVHVEVDIADRSDLAERFAVTSTPTVVLLGPAGEPVSRVVGAPSLAQARAAVAALTGTTVPQ